MPRTNRAALLAAAVSTLVSVAACSASSSEDRAPSDEERLAAAATAAPGEYGSPVDPSLPAPVDVATDTPIVSEVAEGVVSISSAGWNADAVAVEVDGFIPDVIESTGTCTLTLTQGTATATATHPGTPDAASTACASLSVPGDELGSGTWTAVLSYESPVSTASSSPVGVEVP